MVERPWDPGFWALEQWPCHFPLFSDISKTFLVLSVHSAPGTILKPCQIEAILLLTIPLLLSISFLSPRRQKGAEKLSSLSKLQETRRQRQESNLRQFLFGSPALEFHVLLALLYSLFTLQATKHSRELGWAPWRNCRQPPGGALRRFCTHISPNTLGIVNSSALTADTKRLSYKMLGNLPRWGNLESSVYFGFPIESDVLLKLSVLNYYQYI